MAFEWEELNKTAITFLVLVVFIVIGFLVLANVRTNIQSNIVPNVTISEPVEWVNNTFVALANASSAISINCDQVVNNVSGVPVSETLNTTYYTCSTSGINVSDTTSGITSGYNISSFILVNYTYTQPDLAYNATSNSTNALATLPTWLGLLILLVVVGLIIFRVRNMSGGR